MLKKLNINFSLLVIATVLGWVSVEACGGESPKLEGEEWAEEIVAGNLPWRVQLCSDYLVTAACGGSGSKGFNDPGNLPPMIHTGDVITYADQDRKEHTFTVRNISIFTYSKDIDTVYQGQRLTAKKGETSCTLYEEASRDKIVKNEGAWLSTIVVKGCSVAVKRSTGTALKELEGQDLMLMTPHKWAGLSQQGKDLFTLGVLEGWSFTLYSYNAPDLQDFVACASNEQIQRFNSLVWYFGNVKESAVRDITKVTPTICSAYKGKGSSARKPLQLVSKKDWTSFSQDQKSLYVMGYLETGYLLNQTIDPKIPGSLKNCVSSEGMEGILSQIVSAEREFEWEYPIPWSISASLGKACRKYR